MIGRLAERRKKLPQVRDNYASESEYSSVSDSLLSSDRRASGICLLLCFTVGGDILLRSTPAETSAGDLGLVPFFLLSRQGPQSGGPSLSLDSPALNLKIAHFIKRR